MALKVDDDLTQIILFDSDCSMCNRSVQFIMKRDPHAKFQFASLQSEIGKQLLKEHNVPLDTNSVILLRKEQAYTLYGCFDDQ